MSDTYNVEQSRLEGIPAHEPKPINEILDTAHEASEASTETAAAPEQQEERLHLRREAHREREIARAQKARNEELEQQLREQRELTDSLLMLPEEQTAQQQKWQQEQATLQQVEDFQARWNAASPEERAQYQQQVAAAQHEERLMMLEHRANLAASMTTNTFKHGPDKMTRLNEAVGKAMKDGHPEIKELSYWYARVQDPVAMALEWAEFRGLMKDFAPKPINQVFPSNLASARSVGSRTGSNWGGPTPLNNIFKR